MKNGFVYKKIDFQLPFKLDLGIMGLSLPTPEPETELSRLHPFQMGHLPLDLASST